MRGDVTTLDDEIDTAEQEVKNAAKDIQDAFNTWDAEVKAVCASWRNNLPDEADGLIEAVVVDEVAALNTKWDGIIRDRRYTAEDASERLAEVITKREAIEFPNRHGYSLSDDLVENIADQLKGMVCEMRRVRQPVTDYRALCTDVVRKCVEGLTIGVAKTVENMHREIDRLAAETVDVQQAHKRLDRWVESHRGVVAESVFHEAVDEVSAFDYVSPDEIHEALTKDTAHSVSDPMSFPSLRDAVERALSGL